MLKGAQTDEYVKATCKPGTAECCRYLIMGPDGWDCVKHTRDVARYIDGRVERGEFRATGDNCEGVDS